MSEWGLLTNHGLAVVCIARTPGMRLRDIADCVGVTERAAHRIVTDLCEAGYLTRHREGRRNFYELHARAPLAHPLLEGHSVGDLIAALDERQAA